MFIGRIEYRSYDDRDGNTKWVTEIIAERMQFMNIGNGGSSDASSPSKSAKAAPANSSFSPDDSLPF